MKCPGCEKEGFEGRVVSAHAPELDHLACKICGRIPMVFEVERKRKGPGEG